MDLALPALTVELVLVLLAAFAAGCVDAIVGGGGLIQLPALFAFNTTAAPPTLLGTSKLAGIFGTASAVVRFSRRISIPWRALLPLILAVFLTSLAGAYIVAVVPSAVFRPLVPIMLLAVLIYLIRNRDLGSAHAPRGFAGSHHVLGAFLIAAIGFYDGFFGPGTGSFLMFVFVRCYGFDFLHAAASARVLNVATNAAALAYFGHHGHVLWLLGAAMAACNMSGALIGSRLALQGGSVVVRKIFIVVVSLLILRTAWTALTHV